MNRGQISFDLILIMIVAVIFVGSIALVVGVIADNAKIDSIRSQERQIGNEIAEVLNSSTILIGDPANPESDFKITYKIPEIRTANPADPKNCEIQITPDEIQITHTDSKLTITQTIVPFAMDMATLLYIGNNSSYTHGPNHDQFGGIIQCGDTVVISNA